MAFTNFPIPTITAQNWGLSFNVKDFGAVGDGVTDDYSAINAAITAAASVGGVQVFFPPSTSFYKTNTGITVPAGVWLRGGGLGTAIKPGASMNSLISFTGSFGCRISDIALVNTSSFATNGLDFNPTVFGNNLFLAENMFSYFFVNNFKNTNADYFTIKNCWSQGATGYTMRSVYSATGSVIDGLQALGDNAGLYYSPGSGQVTEGAIITNSNIIVTGTGKSIQFDQSLYAQISNTNVAGQVHFADVGAHAFLVVNGLFISPSAGASDTAGFFAEGNLSDIFLSGACSADFSLYGYHIKSGVSGGAQRISLFHCRALGNGTGAGSADLFVDASVAGVGPVFVAHCSLESTGGSVVSVLENNANTVIGSYSWNNVFLSGITSTRTNVTPLANRIPYVNNSSTTGYSDAIAAATVAANLSATHRIPIVLGGTTYYIALSTTPW